MSVKVVYQSVAQRRRGNGRVANLFGKKKKKFLSKKNLERNLLFRIKQLLS